MTSDVMFLLGMLETLRYPAVVLHSAKPQGGLDYAYHDKTITAILDYAEQIVKRLAEEEAKKQQEGVGE